MRCRMRALAAVVLVFSAASSQPLTGPREVTGTLGGSVSVECSYVAEFSDSSKFWCRGPGLSCDILVRTSPSEPEVRKGRVAIRDSRQTGTFTVTMEGLRREDAGIYQCGIDRPALLDHQFPVSVVVLTASSRNLTGPYEVTGTLGGSVSVVCGYVAEFHDSSKYWCRGTAACDILVRTSPSERAVRKDRVTIRDSPQTGTFTVTMEGLRREDAGIYKCGIDRPALPDHQFPVSVVVLTASSQDLTGPYEVTGTLGGSVSIECSYVAEFHDSSKYWCRGAGLFCDIIVNTSIWEREVRKDRVTIRDSPNTGKFTVIMEGLRPEDAGIYRCGTVKPASLDPLFPVSVVVLTDPSEKRLTVTPTVSGTSDVTGTVETEEGSSFTAFNAIQVAQILLLLLSVTVVSLLYKRGTFQSTTPDSSEYVNTSVVS